LNDSVVWDRGDGDLHPRWILPLLRFRLTSNGGDVDLPRNRRRRRGIRM
jgi:hypothetical protein